MLENQKKKFTIFAFLDSKFTFYVCKEEKSKYFCILVVGRPKNALLPLVESRMHKQTLYLTSFTLFAIFGASLVYKWRLTVEKTALIKTTKYCSVNIEQNDVSPNYIGEHFSVAMFIRINLLVFMNFLRK